MDEADSPQQHSQTYGEEVVYTFNKFLIDFVLFLKTTHPEIRKQLKHAYKSVNTKATCHIARMMDVLPLEELGTLADADNAEFFDSGDRKDLEILDGLTVGAILQHASPSTTRYYIYLFGVLCCLAVEDSETSLSDQIAELLLLLKDAPITADVEERVLKISQGNPDVAKMCRCIARQVFAGDSETKGTKETKDIKDALENTKIGMLAKEISDEIDLSNVDVSDPSKLLNFSDFTNQNSFMGKIVSKVGSKIQTKIQTGELRHDDLIKEAMGLLQNLDMPKPGTGGVPPTEDFGSMLQGMMKAFGGVGGGSGGGSGGGATRERLRQQLQKRQAQ
jgi:hypothetical protein